MQYSVLTKNTSSKYKSIDFDAAFSHYNGVQPLGGRAKHDNLV